jgi:hypothetical protein
MNAAPHCRFRVAAAWGFLVNAIAPAVAAAELWFRRDRSIKIEI